MLDWIGLAGLGGRYAHELSGGQQQRVSLGRAMVAKPRAILFDEPLSNLDARLRERMRLELLALRQQAPFTSIYVTHDQLEAMTLADRVVVMRAGQYRTGRLARRCVQAAAHALFCRVRWHPKPAGGHRPIRDGGRHRCGDGGRRGGGARMAERLVAGSEVHGRCAAVIDLPAVRGGGQCAPRQHHPKRVPGHEYDRPGGAGRDTARGGVAFGGAARPGFDSSGNARARSGVRRARRLTGSSLPQAAESASQLQVRGLIRYPPSSANGTVRPSRLRAIPSAAGV